MNFNRVILAGNLTRDPETRSVGEHTVTGFGLAINEKRGGKESTVFIDCEAWNRTGDTIAEYFTKGKPILIEGKLRLDEWQDKDGGKRSKIKVSVDSFTFVGGRDTGESGNRPASGAGRGQSKRAAPEYDHGDIPF